ncbi:MAG TPA: hypothetical protein VFZ89_04340 [Solirubrobacteraceae bacterium]
MAGSLALMTVSTVVAFQGWPGIASVEGKTQPGQLATIDTGKRASHRAKPAALVVPKRPAAPRAAKQRTVPATRVSAAAAPVTRKTVKTQTHPTTRPVVAASTPKVPQSSAPAARKEPTAGDPVRKAGADLGGSVSDAGSKLGDAVGAASPELGDVVKKVTDVVGDVVANTSDLVGKVIDALTGARTP